MRWQVLIADEFAVEMENLVPQVQDAILARAELLARLGPGLGRPYADTLIGSRYANMKELRFLLPDGVWRVAFAFDPQRQAILLVCGNKSGVNEKRFYKSLIAKADQRFADYLRFLKD